MDRDTASLRSATGLDEGARKLILGIIEDVSGYGPGEINVAFFRDRYGDAKDYLEAVEEVHGSGLARALGQVISQAVSDAEYPLDFRPRDPNIAGSRAALLNMPEPDFRLAVEESLRSARRMDDAASRVTAVCRSRGAPWVFDGDDGFQWVGDADVQRELIEPAVSALTDPRFAGGVKSEFESARNELRVGTPQALKQAVHEAACAVESAMKVVLNEHGIAYDPKSTAFPLFDALVNGGIVDRHMQNIVLGPATPRNKKGGHGAGAVPHSPDPAEAGTVVAAAAGAISYLRTRLP